MIMPKLVATYTQTLETNVASLLWLHWSLVLLRLFFNLAKLHCNVNKLWSQIPA